MQALREEKEHAVVEHARGEGERDIFPRVDGTRGSTMIRVVVDRPKFAVVAGVLAVAGYETIELAADAYQGVGEESMEARARHGGSLARAFEAGEPSVVETLLLVVVTRGDPATIHHEFAPYVVEGEEVRWLEQESLEGVEYAGSLHDELARVVTMMSEGHAANAPDLAKVGQRIFGLDAGTARGEADAAIISFLHKQVGVDAVLFGADASQVDGHVTGERLQDWAAESPVRRVEVVRPGDVERRRRERGEGE
jgi:hypothetical protein